MRAGGGLVAQSKSKLLLVLVGWNSCLSDTGSNEGQVRVCSLMYGKALSLPERRAGLESRGGFHVWTALLQTYVAHFALQREGVPGSKKWVIQQKVVYLTVTLCALSGITCTCVSMHHETVRGQAWVPAVSLELAVV